jgi:hypothetical protein
MGRRRRQYISHSLYERRTNQLMCLRSRLRHSDVFDLAHLGVTQEGDRRDSNPRPSEPQSADTCFQALPDVAESA